MRRLPFRRTWDRRRVRRVLTARQRVLGPAEEITNARRIVTTAAIAVCVGLSAVLVWAGRPRTNLAALPQWIHSSLQPDAWWTPLVFAVALGSTIRLVWILRRHTGASLSYTAGVILVATTGLLAAPTYASCVGNQSQVWTPISWTLGLFAGNVADPFDGCGSALPLAIQISRLTAAFTTLLALAAVAATAFRNQIDRVALGLARQIILIVGLNDLSPRFIEAAIREHGADSTIVILTSDPSNPQVDAARQQGARVIIGDATDSSVVRSLLLRINSRSRVNILKSAYILTSEPSVTVSVAANLAAVGTTRRIDRSAPRVVARIDDPTHAEYWRRRQVDNRLSVLTDTIGVYQVTAQNVVDEALAYGARRIVIVGGSQLAVAILDELNQHERERTVTHGGQPAIKRILISPSAEALVADHLRHQSWRSAEEPTSLTQTITEAPSVSAIEPHLLSSAYATVVIVALPPSEHCDRLTAQVAIQFPDTPVLQLSDAVQGVAPFNLLRNVTRFGTTLVASRVINGRRVPVIPEDGWARIARRLHERYLDTTNARAIEKPSQFPWDELSDFFRESNIRRVLTALDIGVRAGRSWIASETGVRASQPLTYAEIKDWAHVEHESWRRYYISHGWRLGPRPKDPFHSLVHPNLVDWKFLDDASRHYTIDSLQECFEHLARFGYQPTVEADMTRYQRCGRVTARRLQHPIAWRTDSGAVMHASPGDWQISDDNGQSWTITDDALRRTYVEIGDGIWERAGVVLARPARANEVVETTEGRDHGCASDWVIQDSTGNRWIVPNDRFKIAYEPAADGATTDSN